MQGLPQQLQSASCVIFVVIALLEIVQRLLHLRHVIGVEAPSIQHCTTCSRACTQEVSAQVRLQSVSSVWTHRRVT